MANNGAATGSKGVRLREDRVVGVMVGAAVGDALGAPYEFGPAGALTRSGAEMQGGGGHGWGPGEWTDDTQMGMHLAASLLACNGLDEADVYARFRAWMGGGPADVGIQTRRVLGSPRPWQTAAAEDFSAGNRSAGNGSLMRTFPAAVFFARAGAEATAGAARRVSALTHGDPLAGECCVVLHELVRVGLAGGTPDVGAALQRVAPEHQEFLSPWLDPSWEPTAGDKNGVCWVTLAQAVWAVRTQPTLAAALRAVVDLGGDTDTVACVTGALAGATWGMQAIPSAWATVVRGKVPGDPQPAAHDLASLQALAFRLIGVDGTPLAPLGAPLPLVEVAPHLFASNLAGARASEGYAVVSLCRGFDHPARQVWLIDRPEPEKNPQLDLAVADTVAEIERLRAEGRDVLVHCHAGQSRTGLIVRAWLQQIAGLSYESAKARADLLQPEFRPNDRFEQLLHDLPVPALARAENVWGSKVAANGELHVRTDYEMPERDLPECHEEWMLWVAQYDGYQLLGPDLMAILRPVIDSYREIGRIPDWCGDHLLRGWLFWHYRSLHWGHEYFDPSLGHLAEWQAAVDALRVRGKARLAAGH